MLHYVEMHEIAGQLFFSKNVLGPSKASVISQTVLNDDQGARPALLVGFIKGSISQSATLDKHKLQARIARMRSIAPQWLSFAQDPDQPLKVFANLKSIQSPCQGATVDLSALDGPYMYNMIDKRGTTVASIPTLDGIETAVESGKCRARPRGRCC